MSSIKKNALPIPNHLYGNSTVFGSSGIGVPVKPTRRASSGILSEILRVLGIRFLFVFTILVCAIISISYIRHDRMQLGYEVVKLQNEIRAQEKVIESLELEVATLKSPERVQTIAKKDLGMVLPSDFVYGSSKAVEKREDVPVATRLQNQ